MTGRPHKWDEMFFVASSGQHPLSSPGYRYSIPVLRDSLTVQDDTTQADTVLPNLWSLQIQVTLVRSHVDWAMALPRQLR